MADGDNRYIVYCYDPSQDNWTSLPPLPVRSFGLGQLNGKLVAVGGIQKSDDLLTGDVFTYNEQSNEWEQTIPPIHTARANPGVLSMKSDSAILVAGGGTSWGATDVVEIFTSSSSGWDNTEWIELPKPCHELSLVTIGNMCYALGRSTYRTQAFYASIDDLFVYSESGMYFTPAVVWKSLPSTPLYESTPAVLSGSLLAVGGKETASGSIDRKEVYVFSPSSNSWIYVSDLPAPRSGCAVVTLSPNQLLVIGGCCDGNKMSSVFKGVLHVNL